MTAYVFVEAGVLDPEGIPAAKDAVESAVAVHRGRFLARGQAPRLVETGSWTEGETVVSLVEFSDLRTAQEWYGSDEYRAAIAAQEGVLDVRLVFVDGREHRAEAVDGR